MPVSASDQGPEVTIRVTGRFDFSTHQEFRQVHEDHKGEGKRFVVDMRGADYMDSSALGMLLMLREDSLDTVRITNCRDELRNILAIANFYKIFTIE